MKAAKRAEGALQRTRLRSVGLLGSDADLRHVAEDLFCRRVTPFLFERKIWIFDYPRSVEPFRNRIRENARVVQMLRNWAKIQPMSTAARISRALVLAAVLCTAGRVFSGASTHAQKDEVTSHQPKIPIWIDDAERRSPAYSPDEALPSIPAIALGLPNLTSVVIPRITHASRRSKGAALFQRPPPPPSSI